MTVPSSVGLCAICRHARRIQSARSTFVMCTRGLTDPAYPKYPPLPVRVCAGHEPEAPPAAPAAAES